MQIQSGFELVYFCPQETAMLLMLQVHPSRFPDLLVPGQITTDPFVPITDYHDSFGNCCGRIVAPPGRIRLSSNTIVRDTGEPDLTVPGALQHNVNDLPQDALAFLLGSRYCKQISSLRRLGIYSRGRYRGWDRVQAICNYVHNHIVFNYNNARCTRTAWETFQERTGVCRDFAHLAITFCRCMNIPARYCTGYLGDIGVPPPYPPGDFCAWIEVYLSGRWHTFDPRNNVPRVGRVLMARGRDATDVAISTTFGPTLLESFRVWSDEIADGSVSIAA